VSGLGLSWVIGGVGCCGDWDGLGGDQASFGLLSVLGVAMDIKMA
jgi:hypothetical protein